MADIVLWAVALIVFLVIEGVTAQLVTIWFAAGALAAMIVAIFSDMIWLELIIFAVVSGITLAVTRPLVKKLTKNKITHMNADRCIGETGIVTETIDNLKGTGCIKIGGIAWTARSSDGSIIEEGENASVEKIEGVKVIVKKSEIKKEN